MSLFTRSVAVALTTAVLLSGCAAGSSPSDTTRSASPLAVASNASSARAFEQLESRYEARLGVYAIDLTTGQEVGYRADERFAFASTFKALAAGALLADQSIDPEEAIPVTPEMIIDHSPVTEQHVGRTMTLAEAADAAIRFSDNAAANILLDRLGGPAGFQAALRTLGDATTRSDRREQELNDWKPGDERDTSTPQALATTLHTVLLGDALADERRRLLVDWMKNNTTGDELIRAGVPSGSTVADKTGAGGTFGTRNDIAVVWPPSGGPVAVAILSNRHDHDADYDNTLIADATRVVWKTLGR